MNSEWKETWGKRAAAVMPWPWMAGIRGLSPSGGFRVARVTKSTTWVVYDDTHGEQPCDVMPHEAIPDLTDPTTLWCLVYLCRERHVDGFYLMPHIDDGGRCRGTASYMEDWRAECLVMGLEATK